MACREARPEEIEACHRPELVCAVAALSAAAAGSEGEPTLPAYLSQDTYINSDTYLCARLAAGGCIDVASAVARCAAVQASHAVPWHVTGTEWYFTGTDSSSLMGPSQVPGLLRC